MSKLCRILPLLFILVLGFTSPVAATDNTSVTGGTARSYSSSGIGFNLRGQGFAATGGVAGYVHTHRDSQSNQAETLLFHPGDTVFVSSTYDDFLGTNTATFNGIPSYPVYYGGFWEFFSGAIVLPDVQSRLVAVSVPFTMQGSFDGYSKSYQSAIRPDDVVFSTTLKGQGIVTMLFTGRMDFNGWVYELQKSSVIYNFQPAANLPETIRLSSTAYSISENDASGVALITVNRAGDTSSASSVDYSTDDVGTAGPCQETGSDSSASAKCDYTTTVGTLHFAPGEVSKTIRIPVINDAYVEPDEVFAITLRNAQGGILGANATAIVTILNDDTQTATKNPIDNQSYFIKQQYIDFLGRTAEDAGFQFWMNRMNNCPAGQVCDRIDTSMRFFQSDEFQARGFFVYRLYDALFGFLPKYDVFMSDVARLSGAQTITEQRQSKDAYLLDFINSDYFKILYSKYLSPDGLKATDAVGFVNALCAKAGITPASKQALINNLQNGTRDPAHTVEDFINTPEISAVGTKFYDRGFITMQYFGYLRRDPDDGGFQFWQNQLIGPNAAHRGDYRFMVGGFINSDEYCFRFAKISAAH